LVPASQDPKQAAAQWRSAGVYTICLIAAFKDDRLATRQPALALRSRLTSRVIRDGAGLDWVDPAAEAAQEYNIAVALAAARAGFDEVQFDFVRYPAEPLSQEGMNEAEERRRLQVIAQFLRRAAAALAPHKTYLSASMFGMTCSSQQSGVIGQRIEEFAESVDYISPMLYPSSFRGPGTGTIDPFRLVQENLDRAAARLGGRRERVRPWLQGFPDPPVNGNGMDPVLLREQVRAAREARVNGWMVWNSRSRYPQMEPVAPVVAAAR